MAEQDKADVGIVRRILRWCVRVLLSLAVVAAAAFVTLFWDALHNYFVVFPKEAQAWERIRSSKQEVGLDDGWTEYRGACHSHSELSHDSEVPFPEILAGLKKADLNFICMSDHCTDNKADYSKQWNGLHDGVLFVRGFEMSGGFMPWGLPETTVLDNSAEPRALAAQIQQAGGLLFFAHSEEERLWDLPELNGMEIYNIHTDFKQAKDWRRLLTNFILCAHKYPDQMIRTLYHPQADILKHWDELNRTRKITGIAANDCHQNNGVRGYYTDNDTLLVRTTGPDDVIGEYKLNAVTRTLLRLFPGPLESGAQLFRVELDPYERSLRFVNTHVLAKELSEPALLDALKQGRVFVAFDMLADARGFAYVAQDGQGRSAVMGESIPLTSGLKLRAQSPYPVKFTIIRDGVTEKEEEGLSFEFPVTKPGKYRVEADLKVGDQWTDWLFTNPLEVTVPAQTVNPA